MNLLNIDNVYNLRTPEERALWFSNTLYQQDCDYRSTHCSGNDEINLTVDRAIY